MNIHTKILTAAITFALLITGVTIIADTSDVSSAEEPTYNVTLTDTLYFDSPANCSASVEKINLQAGTNVCEYADDCLTFRKNVNITLNSSSSNKGVFIFGVTDTSQNLDVDSDVTVSITYHGNIAAASDDIGAVKKINGGSLTFAGNGTLKVTSNVPNTYAVYSSGNFCFDGRSYLYSELDIANGGLYCKSLYCSNGSFGYINSYTNGVIMYGSEINFDTCTIKIYGVKYGVRCDNLSKMSVSNCTADIIGANDRAFSKNPSNASMTFTNIYGTNNLSGENSSNDIDLLEIKNYKHVSMTPQISSGNLVATVIITISVVVLLVIIGIVIIKVKNKKNPTPPKTTSPPAPESVYEAKTHPVSECAPENIPRGLSDNGNTDVMAQSMAEGVSFALVVDGRIVGYIGPQPSFITVQTGMREITVVTNDTDRKTVYQKNHMIRPGTKITVSKKIGGYKVEVQ